MLKLFLVENILALAGRDKTVNNILDLQLNQCIIMFHGINTSSLEQKPRLVLFILANLIISLSLYAQYDGSLPITIRQAVDTAIANNLIIQNARLQVEYAKVQQKGVLNLDPVEVNYRWGQINSSESDYYLEINQNFGSILTHAQMLRKVRLNYEQELTAFEITMKQLTAEVKSAYLFWQYQYAITQLWKDEASMFERLAEISELRYNTGDIMLLQKATAASKVAEIKSRYFNSLDDLTIASLKLQQLLSTNSKLRPISDSYEMYEITKTADTGSYRGELFVSYFDVNYNLARTNELIAKSQYFPNINAGFFTQEISNEHGLYGWQIGITVPLWINSRQSEISQSKIESKMAFNELEYNKNRIAFEIENLLYTLNKYFRLIRYYETEALPQAEILLNTAESQLDLEEIDFTEFLQSVSLAIQIREEYLSMINQYNQTAIQLEIYEK